MTRRKSKPPAPKTDPLSLAARSDRLLGLPFRVIAKRNGMSLTTAWRRCKDVSPVRWDTRLQKARWGKPERPLPLDPRVHAYLAEK